MDEKTFEKEIETCRKLNQKNNGKCNWGRCENCGVIPLLYKIFKKKIFEDKNEIKKMKEQIFD